MVSAIFCAMTFYYFAMNTEGAEQIACVVALFVSLFCALWLWEKTQDRISALEHKLKEKDNEKRLV